MQHPPPAYTYASSDSCSYAFAFATLHESRTPCEKSKRQINRQRRQLYRKRYASNTEMREYDNTRPLRTNNISSLKLWRYGIQDSTNRYWVLLKPLQLDQVGVSIAVIGVMGWISVNGLVVVIVGAFTWVMLFGSATRGIVVASRQRPNHPYSTQDVVSAGVAFVGVGDNVVVSRHPPNHPYFTQDVVGISVVELEVELEVLVKVEVVVSSRHPNCISCSSQKQHRAITYPTSRESGKL